MKNSYLFKKNFLSSYNNIFLILSQIRVDFCQAIKYCLNSHSNQERFIFLFLFQYIYEIVDSEYGTDNYKSSKIRIVVIMKNP